MRKQKKSKSHLLIVTPTFFPIVGGAEVGIHELAVRLSKKYTVTILTPIAAVTNNLTDFKTKKYTVIRFTPFLTTENRILQKISKPFSLLALSYIFAIRSYINKNKPDVINFHYATPSGLALIFVKIFYNIPCILSIVGRVDVYNEQTSMLRKRYLALIFYFANKIISINEFCVKGFSHKVTIIPYGVDVKRYSQANPSKEVQQQFPNKTILFSLQRLEEVKRVDVLIAAMKHIKKKRNDVVLLIGGSGKLKNTLENLVAKFGLQRSVFFLGHIKDNDIPSLYRTSKIFVLHTTFETFGVVLAQAMASGKAIVSTNVTAVPYVVKNNINGILVKPLDAKKLSEAILQLLNNNNLLHKISVTNKVKARQEFNWNTISNKYARVFSSA